MRTLIISILLFAGFTSINAQVTEPVKLEGHYLGIQVNELVRQVFSLGNTAVPSNPYFFNYTYTSATGSGLNVSMGLTVDETNASNNFSNVTTNIDNFSFRVGYDKKKVLTKRFIFSLGVDLTIDSQKNVTLNQDSFSSQEIETTNKLSGWGLGPRFTFQYRISDNILIGTEANYYYKSLKDKFSIEVNGSSTNDEQETDIKRFTFSAPAILWLSVRL